MGKDKGDRIDAKLKKKKAKEAALRAKAMAKINAEEATDFGLTKKLIKSRSKWGAVSESTEGIDEAFIAAAKKEESKTDDNKCPTCGWIVLSSATKCPFCDLVNENEAPIEETIEEPIEETAIDHVDTSKIQLDNTEVLEDIKETNEAIAKINKELQQLSQKYANQQVELEDYIKTKDELGQKLGALQAELSVLKDSLIEE